MFRSIIIHIRSWNAWRKHNINSKFYKICVLLKIANSPTFNMYEFIEETAQKYNAVSYSYKDDYENKSADTPVVTIIEKEK